MIDYEFVCPECEQRYITAVSAERLDACRTTDCPGVPLRKWNGSFIRSNIRAVPK